MNDKPENDKSENDMITRTAPAWAWQIIDDLVQLDIDCAVAGDLHDSFAAARDAMRTVPVKGKCVCPEPFYCMCGAR